MRTILLTRGLQGSGKSTWVKENNLEPYTLSADKIRLLMQSPITNIDGNLVISQKNDGKVWKLLFEILEQRMERGEFIVVDATHYKKELLQRYYNLIEKYRYRAFIVDFTDVPLETCLERNSKRDKYKFVPEEVIRKVSAVFELEKQNETCREVSKKFTIIKPDEVQNMFKKEYLLKNYTDLYEKIVVFGDIHGCIEPLNNYFKKNNFRDDYLYIFTGDYLDRGIQNLEVLQFLQTIYNKKNVILLEGNHEVHLRKYSEKNCDINSIKSGQFKNHTIPQIESFDKKELRQICRKFSQLEYFEFGINKYVVCHGGIPCIPSILISTEELIKGVGKYEEEEQIGKKFGENTDCLHTLIHGHRNIFNNPAYRADYHYNLCDTPEFGGNVRILEISKNGEINIIYEPNTIFDTELVKREEKLQTLEIKTDNDLINQLNSSKYISKKVLDNGIISYNFTRDVFYKSIWNDLTVKARGLFVDNKTNEVVARGYNKFWNVSENDFTSLSSLKQNLKFPVKAYRKENGFLALVSYDKFNDDLFVASKSTTKGDFVPMIKTEINKFGEEFKNKVKDYVQANNCTLIFECINQDLDPHIIRYKENGLILLDIVTNSFEPQFLSYEDLMSEAKYFGLKCKQLEHTFVTWNEFYNFIKLQEISYNCQHEGWVFEDSQKFMVKYKTKYYKLWKYMRSIKQKLEKNQNIKNIFKDENEVRVFNFMRSKPIEELASKSIIDISEEYYKSIRG